MLSAGAIPGTDYHRDLAAVVMVLIANPPGG
jgi:hypothetical protein